MGLVDESRSGVEEFSMGIIRVVADNTAKGCGSWGKNTETGVCSGRNAKV